MNIKKINKFRQTVKENRKLLLDAGINKYAIRSWRYTSRIPSEPNAKKIAAVLGVPLSEIPYYRTERVI